MKWISRKLFLSVIGLVLYSGLPVLFKHFAVTDGVTLASLGGITLIVGYYFKVNVDAKKIEMFPLQEVEVESSPGS